ncbi:hypothetical protein GCK32_020503 [Trichostrongylus colubriformis]|uniref:Uncharacterized protein n=1 Tax=Trichostrongylus colubriformis TaxID=6319 RepID=A0AAN8FLG0_TRICO
MFSVPDCPHTLATHDDVNYLIVEGGIYSQKLEMPNYAEAPSKLLCLCCFHNGIFEFMFDIIHMKWNIYHNCLVHGGIPRRRGPLQ